MYYRTKPDEPKKIEMCTVNSPNDDDWTLYEECKSLELAEEKVRELLVPELLIAARKEVRLRRERNAKSRL